MNTSSSGGIKKFRSNAGFSLVELSIVLVIVSIIAYSVSAVVAVQAEKGKIDATKAKLDRIESALALYQNTNGGLPCPARGNVLLGATGAGDLTFGTEVTPHGANAGNVCDDAGNIIENDISGGANTSSIYRGVVPVRTLNLPDDYMFDGWGRRITYVVDSSCVKLNPVGTWAWSDTDSMTNLCADGTPDSSGATTTAPATDIVVCNTSTTGCQDTGNTSIRTTDAAYVLISHGKNGVGAWPKNVTGSRVGYNTVTGAESENADIQSNGTSNGTVITNATDCDTPNSVDVCFCDGPMNIGNTNSYFDDLVRWKTANQIVVSN